MKADDVNVVVGLLNRRRSINNDIVHLIRTEWSDGIEILFQTIPLELSEVEFNFVMDIYFNKLNTKIKEIDDELTTLGITMENE